MVILFTDNEKQGKSKKYVAWKRTNRVEIGGKTTNAEDQLLLIFAAIQHHTYQRATKVDSDKLAWHAVVVMTEKNNGFYTGSNGWRQEVKVIGVEEVEEEEEEEKEESMHFNVTTYNILTGGPLWTNMSQYEQGTTGLPHALWTNRRNRVVNAVISSDIVMLNEATIAQTEFVKNQTGFNIGCQKLKYNEVDGSAILFDSTVFEKVDEFSAVIRSEYPQVVVAARFMHRATHQQVVFVSLHLTSGYDDAEHRRVLEFRAAMRWVNNKWNDLHEVAVVVAGDLNSDYRNKYAVLVKTFVPKLKTPKLRNAAAEQNGIGVKTPTYNYWHLSTFDYILVSPQLAVRSMHTEDAKHRAPNASQGSDHFPVTAVLEFI